MYLPDSTMDDWYRIPYTSFLYSPQPGAEDTKLWLKINRGVHNRAKQSDVEQMLEDVPEERLRPPQTWQSKVEIKRQIKKGVLLNRYRLPN